VARADLWGVEWLCWRWGRLCRAWTLTTDPTLALANANHPHRPPQTALTLFRTHRTDNPQVGHGFPHTPLQPTRCAAPLALSRTRPPSVQDAKTPTPTTRPRARLLLRPSRPCIPAEQCVAPPAARRVGRVALHHGPAGPAGHHAGLTRGEGVDSSSHTGARNGARCQAHTAHHGAL
jgi:hypothetical protein